MWTYQNAWSSRPTGKLRWGKLLFPHMLVCERSRIYELHALLGSSGGEEALILIFIFNLGISVDVNIFTHVAVGDRSFMLIKILVAGDLERAVGNLVATVTLDQAKGSPSAAEGETSHRHHSSLAPEYERDQRQDDDDEEEEIEQYDNNPMPAEKDR